MPQCTRAKARQNFKCILLVSGHYVNRKKFESVLYHFQLMGEREEEEEGRRRRKEEGRRRRKRRKRR